MQTKQVFLSLFGDTIVEKWGLDICCSHTRSCAHGNISTVCFSHVFDFFFYFLAVVFSPFF